MARSDPRRRDRQEGDCRCLPIAEWPAPDASAWAAALEPGEVLEPGGPAAHWSLASRRKTSNGYGRFLGWLDNIGNLDPACACPTERVTQQQAAAYVDHLLARNRGYTVLCRVQELYDAIRVMAPGRDWTWLRKMGSAIRSRTSQQKAGRIQPRTGWRNWSGADNRSGHATDHASPACRAVRDGLMISFLAYRPLQSRTWPPWSSVGTWIARAVGIGCGSRRRR